jgi:hypothetical protein
MMPERFSKLRDMESFTDGLMDRLFAFQEKRHPAWDESQPFTTRMANLSLHNLIFSNPDRDPQQFGPTIAHYYPLREENRALVHYIRHVAEDAQVLDLHARNGFIGTLLAHEGAKVVGLRDPAEKPNQIANFYDPAVYELRDGSVADVDFPVDVVLSAWMPMGKNFTPEILKLKPKMIIYIYTEHTNEYSGERQTGTNEAFDNLPANYRIVDEWSIARPANLLQEAWPDLSPSLEETRVVRIYADESVADIPQYEITEPVQPYDWEAELEMALLAMEAKQELRARGIAV